MTRGRNWQRGATRTGFVYTMFAMLVLGMTLTVTLLPLTVDRPSRTGEQVRVDEVFYFLKSVNDDFDRVTGIIGRRAMTALSNRIVNNGTYLNDSKDAFREVFENGTINDTAAALMNRSSFTDWSASMEDEAAKADYNLSTDINAIDLGFDPPLDIELNVSYRYNLSDDITSTRFERTRNVSQTVSFAGVEDPLILVESVGRYTNFYAACQRRHPAQRHASGGDWFYEEVKNWTSGTAVVRPGNNPVDSVSNPGRKIAIVDDLCSYSDLSDFSGFEGVVSESDAIDGKDPNNNVDACGETDVNIDALVDDAAGATAVANDSMAVMTEDQVWQNNLKNWTDEACYFSDPTAPTVWGRLEGRLTSAEGRNGTEFLLTVPDLPAELEESDTSAVTHVYFNDSGDFGDARKIKGVTDQDMSWFRLDQDHVDEWGIGALAHD